MIEIDFLRAYWFISLRLRSRVSLMRFGLFLAGVFALCLSLVTVDASHARGPSRIVPENLARRLGLTRSWAFPIQLDRTRGRVTHLLHHDNLILVQTDQSTIHALDAETGMNLWITRVSTDDYPMVASGVNDRLVIVAAGDTLYGLDRRRGEILWERRLPSAATGGILATKDRAFVCMTTGQLMGFSLIDPRDKPIGYNGGSLSDTTPIMSQTSLVWATAKGQVYAANPANMNAVFRVALKEPIWAEMATNGPFIFVGGRDGYVYALSNLRGTKRWTFSTGHPIDEPIMFIPDQPFSFKGTTGKEDSLYVIPQSGGMLRIAAADRTLRWTSPGVGKFLSASDSQIFVMDDFRNLLMLDAVTGSRLGEIPNVQVDFHVANSLSDRIYFCSDVGVVQCLRQSKLKQPYRHRVVGGPAPAVPATGPAPAEGQGTTTETPPAEGGGAYSPFDKSDENAEGDEQPAEDGENAGSMEEENTDADASGDAETPADGGGFEEGETDAGADAGTEESTEEEDTST